MEAAGTRNRSSARHGAAVAFSGSVRRWRKQWTAVGPTRRLLVLRWTPQPPRPTDANCLAIRRKPKYIPVRKRLHEFSFTFFFFLGFCEDPPSFMHLLLSRLKSILLPSCIFF
ncbi:unnamed protein product [Closterium sp. Naga37s-1]|nr:unnamed protein product [Closterium sp. Naga37s-1]